MTTTTAGANNNNSSGGEGDDARKKRGNSQDEREAFKKVRSETNAEETKESSIGNASLPLKLESGDKNHKTALQQQHVTNERSKAFDSTRTTTTCAENPPRVWDLESAILYLAQIGKAGGKRKRPDISSSSLMGTSKTSADTKSTDKTIETDTLEAAAAATMEKEEDEKTSPLIVREYLTDEETSWITFRAAHAGDASTIAQWYRHQRSRQDQRNSKQDSSEATRERVPEEEEPELEKPPRPSSSNEEEALSDRRRRPNNSNDAALDNDDVETAASSSLQLEHWLAEGLGDENTCPFVHGLLAYVQTSGENENNDKTATDSNPSSPTMSTTSLQPPTTSSRAEDEHCSGHQLAAVVLMSLSWAFGKRTLRIEWMSMDASSVSKKEGMALRQKVWLRIHTLSAMTACRAISVDQQVLRSAASVGSEKEPLEGKVSSHKSHFVEPSAE